MPHSHPFEFLDLPVPDVLPYGGDVVAEVVLAAADVGGLAEANKVLADLHLGPHLRTLGAVLLADKVLVHKLQVNDLKIQVKA